jgi:putative transposase
LSEAQFKTMKYRPEFPDRFGGPGDARVFCTRFFPWCNEQNRHSGTGCNTPADVHYDRAGVLREQRAEVLTVAYATHPEVASLRSYGLPTSHGPALVHAV